MGMELKPANGFEPSQLIYVIDDDIAIRRSLHFLLSTLGYTTWPFACAFDFLENLTNLQAAPILLDIRMPEIDGMDLMVELFNREIRWPIIVMTAYADIPFAVQAIKHGAIDLLEKPLDFELLQKSLDTAVAQLVSIKDAALSRRNACCLFESLSPREIEVVSLLIDGHQNKVVAYRLSLSVRTVEMHRANALQKLKVRSIAEVAHLARHAGLLVAQQQAP
jgi:two-component system response regulator FixJ